MEDCFRTFDKDGSVELTVKARFIIFFLLEMEL